MIKAVIFRPEEDCDYPQKCTDKNDPPATEARQWYEYTVRETCYPQVSLSTKHEALLDEEGKPYIHSWNEVAYKPSYEEWCTAGTDHHQKIREVHSFAPVANALYKEYEYSRTLAKGCWIAVYDELDSLAKDLKKFDGELIYSGQSVTNIDFEITFNV